MTVNNTLTQTRFGYTCEEISPFSTKIVVIDCDFCLKPFERRKTQFKKPSRRDYPHACPKCDQIKSNWKKQNELSPTAYHVAYPSLMGKKDFSSIDWDETTRLYGYTKDDVNPRSEKKLINNCDFCLKPYTTSLATLNRKGPPFACYKCSPLKSLLKTGQSARDIYLEKRVPVDFRYVDVEATKLNFGYDPAEIPALSEKKINVVCFNCGGKFESRMDWYTKAGFNLACESSKCRYLKTQNTLFSKYGVRTTLDIPSVKAKLTDPSTEKIIAEMLTNKYKVECERNHIIGQYSFDFFIPSLDLLIECQGDHFHDFKTNGYSGTARDQAKATWVGNNTSYKLIHIWEHEIHVGRVKKVLDYHLGTSRDELIKTDVNDLVIKKIPSDEAFAFLSLYHYLGSLGRGSTNFGVYTKDVLIAVCSFGHVTRHETLKKTGKSLDVKMTSSQACEIKRFAIRTNVECRNLGSWALSQAINGYRKLKPEIKYIISFADTSVGDSGGLYKASNFTNLGTTPKSYHYLDGVKAIHKKTVYEIARSAHMTEREFVEKSNLVKIEEKPKQKWVFIHKP